VEVSAPGAAPAIERVPTGQLHWLTLERDIEHEGQLAEVACELDQIEQLETTLVRLVLAGFVSPEDREILEKLEEVVETRFLYGELDTSGLLARPESAQWVEALPHGLLRETAETLLAWASASEEGRTEIPRPEYATPEVATRALLELYRFVQEGSHDSQGNPR